MQLTDGDDMRIVSWNVNGLRARVNHGKFLEFCEKYSPDILCLQEIKMFPWQKQFDLGEVYEYWNPSRIKGASGTAVFSKRKAISMTADMGTDLKENDGRVITLEYDDFYLVTVYVPTGTGVKRKEAIQDKLLWLKSFVKYLSGLSKRKPIILCGDMNIAHNEIDLSYPDSKSAGFTDEERNVITTILDNGFADAYRYLHPDAAGQYTWASNRFKTGGLRLDYFFVSNALRSYIIKADILRDEAPTDHCPILLELDEQKA